MDTTTLSALLLEEGVFCHTNGMVITAHPSWTVKGENRVSYTTIIRLVECCREHHWNKDISAKTLGKPLDSTSKELHAEFHKSIPIGATIAIDYRISEIRNRGYSINFTVQSIDERTLFAEITLVAVFIDPINCSPIKPPKPIYDHLLHLKKNKEV